MKRNIIIVSNDQRNLKNFRGHIIKKFLRDGLTVHTFCIGEESRYELSVRSFYTLLMNVAANFLQCFRILGKSRNEIVLVYSFPLCVFFAVANVFVGHKNLHLFISGRGRLFNKLSVLNHFKFIFALLPQMSKTLYVLNNLDYKFFTTKNKKPVKFFGEGLDLEKSDDTETTPRTYTLGYVGRLEKIKGITILNQIAISQSVIIFGDGPDRHLISQNDNIRFNGYQSEKADIYKDFDILIFPSLLYEGLPMVIVEAMHFGKPIIWNIKNKSLDNDVLTITNSIGVDFQNEEEVSMAIEKIDCNYTSYSSSARNTITSDFYSDSVYARYRKFMLE